MHTREKVRKSVFGFVVLLLLLPCVNPRFAAAEPSGASLIIMGPGDAMYEYWGHIGIAIENDSEGTSLFYDFGNFSFHADNFYGNFIMGRMIYLGSVTATEFFIEQAMREDKDLSIYPLNLGAEELREMDASLRWMTLRENREYLYDYFFNNCSTIIRDILDGATGGALRASTESIPDRTYRHYARTGARPSFFNEVLIHFLLGERQDEEISVWDLMFIPQEVADAVLGFEYLGRDGVARVLTDEEIVLKKSPRSPGTGEPRILWPWLLALSIALGMLWNTGVGLLRALIILLAGIPGLILGFLMLFTDHAAAYGNINIWPSMPSVLLGLFLLAIRGGKRWSAWREATLGWIWTINLAGLSAALFLRLSGISIQSAGAFWALYGPLTLMASHLGQWLKGKLHFRLGEFGRRGGGDVKQTRFANNGD